MQTASSIAPLHRLGQDDQDEVQPDFSGHVTPLAVASASLHTDGIVSSTITFHRSREST